MRLHTGVWLLCMCCAFTAVNSQEKTVPYFDRDTLLVEALIDGKKTTLIYDTGASLTALFKGAASRLKIDTEPGGRIKLAGHPLDVSKTSEVEISMFGKNAKTRHAVLPLTNQYDGVLGWRSVKAPLMLNGYQQATGWVTAFPKSGNWQTFKLEGETSQLFFQVTKNEKPYGRVFVDTGVSGALRLSPALWEEWKKQNPDKLITLEAFRYSVGETMVNEVAWTEDYQLGDLTFHDIDIGQIPTAKNGKVIDSRGKEFIATIGIRALRNLQVIINQKDSEIWTRSISGRPRHNRLGAVFVNWEKGPICHVLPDSPAAKAGLKNGDVLRQLNGVDSEKLNAGVMAKVFSQAEGTKLTMIVEREKKEISFEVTLRNMMD